MRFLETTIIAIPRFFSCRSSCRIVFLGIQTLNFISELVDGDDDEDGESRLHRRGRVVANRQHANALPSSRRRGRL